MSNVSYKFVNHCAARNKCVVCKDRAMVLLIIEGIPGLTRARSCSRTAHTVNELVEAETLRKERARHGANRFKTVKELK